MEELIENEKIILREIKDYILNTYTETAAIKICSLVVKLSYVLVSILVVADSLVL
jgi:hypothetical protein